MKRSEYKEYPELYKLVKHRLDEVKYLKRVKNKLRLLQRSELLYEVDELLVERLQQVEKSIRRTEHVWLAAQAF